MVKLALRNMFEGKPVLVLKERDKGYIKIEVFLPYHQFIYIDLYKLIEIGYIYDDFGWGMEVLKWFSSPGAKEYIKNNAISEEEARVIYGF